MIDPAPFSRAHSTVQRNFGPLPTRNRNHFPHVNKRRQKQAYHTCTNFTAAAAAAHHSRASKPAAAQFYGQRMLSTSPGCLPSLFLTFTSLPWIVRPDFHHCNIRDESQSHHGRMQSRSSRLAASLTPSSGRRDVHRNPSTRRDLPPTARHHDRLLRRFPSSAASAERRLSRGPLRDHQRDW